MSTTAAAVTVLAATASAGGAWRSHTPLPAPRTEVAAAYANGRIVVVGGFTASGGTSRRTDAYVVGDDRWERLPDLPAAVDHAAAASADGRVYVLGGYGGDRRQLDTAYVLERGHWRKLPSLPDARAAAAAAITNGRLYLVGGRTRTGLAQVALVLELATSRWSRVPGPIPREHLAAAALDGRIYALGGRKAGYDTNVPTVEAYDAKARRWRAEPSLPQARGGTGATTLGGRIVSVGGEAPGGTIGSVYAYRLGMRRWTRLPDLPTPRHGLGVVTVGGRVYVVAGGPEPGLTTSGAVESIGLP